MLLLEARKVCKSYRTGTGEEIRALHEVSLSIDCGQAIALVGPSGAGKTTLLALLGAIERPTRGQVLFHGQDLGLCSGTELTRVRRAIGHIFQSFSLIPELTVLENVTYPLIPRGVRRTERNRRALEWLTRLGLDGRARERVRTLSGGEQQRVVAARALICQPEIILADEPTSNLDLENARVLIAEFGILRKAGTAFILAAHDPLVVGLADRVLELEAGQLKPQSEPTT
ncbi:MAG TPA: ABC transporter ATP-binding protein [Gemmata sp.]|jgi:ABC-type lipoprotein export system ATPase subunit|nr:ABC transporter ATP-binding protein [Gemmata sp.]